MRALRTALAICRDNGLEVILISALEMSFRTLIALGDGDPRGDER
jgi:hypothetical protein